MLESGPVLGILAGAAGWLLVPDDCEVLEDCWFAELFVEPELLAGCDSDGWLWLPL